MDEDYHGDRKKASDDMAVRGWQYLRAGDHSDAMRRFNQSWLLNTTCFRRYRWEQLFGHQVNGVERPIDGDRDVR